MPKTILIIFFFISAHYLHAQVDSVKRVALDSVKTVIQDTAVQDTVKKETRAERKAREKAEKEREKYYYKDILKDSTRLSIEEKSRVAWRRSAFVPGWGQITNGGKWMWVKLPMVYGGFVAGYMTFDYWNWHYQKFVKEAAFRIDNGGDKSDPDLINYDSLDGLIRSKDNYRRNRDMVILGAAVWWAGWTIEAYVDSMLKNRYDISDDLGFKISPTLLSTGGQLAYQPNFGNQFAPGIKLTLSIK